MGANKINWKTFELKLKRYKFGYKIDTFSNSITIGKMNMTRLKLLYVGLPVVLCIVLSFVAYSNIFSSLSEVKLWIFSVVMGIAGIAGIVVVKRVEDSNQTEKVIGPGRIEIRDQNTVVLPLEKIKSIFDEIESPKGGEEFFGSIMIETKDGQKHKLMTIVNGTRHLLKDDVAYLTKFIKEVVELER